MTIRRAEENDAPPIQKLILQLGYKINLTDVVHNLKMYSGQNAAVLAAMENDGMVGFISGASIPLFHINETMFRITALCVEEAQRGKGIGKSLVTSIEEWCIKSGCFYTEVTSGAHRHNDAHLFYKSLGYKTYDGRRFQKRLSK